VALIKLKVPWKERIEEWLRQQFQVAGYFCQDPLSCCGLVDETPVRWGAHLKTQ